ncbi:hypothetical protein AGMMS50239_36900 [Bacteroidia bacterium]|nr:hypothetical protein AGMMS50239_36900 [Bacteroidia bacterium]
METSEIMYKINRMPKRERMFIAERIIHSLLEEKKNSSLKKAVDCLSDDYRIDKDLTAFTQLDFEDFYETR